MDNVNTYKVNKEAVKKIAEKVYDNGSTVINRNDLEELFPELKESEDEKIRNQIIEHIKWSYDEQECAEEEMHRWISWLEKQGEQKPTDLALYNDLKPWEKPEYIIKAINRKRVEPALKGYALHKFKNELNSLKQILHLLYDSYDNPVNYRLALHWASWGAQNLQGYFGISKEEREKMDDVTGEQKPAEWSEEDEEILNSIIAQLHSHPNVDLEEYSKEYDWLNYTLKSLRPQNWTKEDKERYISCLQRLSTGNPEQPEIINSKWFKEHVYPKSTWKPSDEQMDALEAAIVDSISSIQKHSLESLFKELKKL